MVPSVQFSGSVGSGLSYGYPGVYGEIAPMKDTDPQEGWLAELPCAVGQAVHRTEKSTRGATVRDAVLYAFMRWSV